MEEIKEETGINEYSNVSETQDLSENFQIFRLDTSRILAELDHHLKGETFDQEREEWIKVGKPLLNETGRRQIITHLNFFINPNIILSKIDPEQIDIICYDVDYTLDKLLVANQDKWEIGSLQDVSMLKKDMIMFIEAALHRAERGFESKSIGKVMKTLETIKSNEKKKKLPFIAGRSEET